jgi:2-aminoethylphosphonate-pyruvate transaminase
MTAVILAAGLGSRMGASEARAPKCLLRIGGQTLIERSLASISRAGVRDAIVVNGYGAAEIEGVLAAHPLPSIRFVRNPDFGSTGSMQSLLRARHILSDDILVLESDLLYEERAIAAILDQGNADGILVSAPLKSGDDVWVHADPRGALSALGKAAPRDGAIGALVGISRLSRSFMEHLLRYAESESRAGQWHYEEGILAASLNGFPVHCVTVPDLAWIEIDTPADLMRAEQSVWPEIQRRANGVS